MPRNCGLKPILLDRTLSTPGRVEPVHNGPWPADVDFYICREINLNSLFMKHLYLAAVAVGVAAGAVAQGRQPVAPMKDAQLRRVSAVETPAAAGANRVEIWSNTCAAANCSDWVFDNAAGETGQPWEGIDINFECTTDGPTGPYNQWAGGTGDGTAASDLNSTTANDGWIIVDSDLFGADANYSASWIENAWFQTANAIDCSAFPFVSVGFQTRYRCWDNGSSDDSEKCLVEVSRDGVTWPDVNTVAEADGFVDYGSGPVQARWEVFPSFETTDETTNPQIAEFDITGVAGGQGTVWIRFRWVGTWGYSWEVDDISVYETPANDVRIDTYTSYTDYETSGIYEYGVWASSQVIDLDYAAKVYNVGYQDQTGTAMALTVNGTDAGTSNAVTLGYQGSDTLRVTYTLGGVGTDDLAAAVATDFEDENPGNNSASASVEVSDLHFGRDNGEMLGLFPGDGTDDFIACNPMQIFNDLTIYAIDVAIAEGSENGTPIIAHLFDGADANFLVEQYGGLLVSSAELDLVDASTNDGTEAEVLWYTLVLEEPYTAAAGDLVGAGFEHYGGSNVQIWESKYTQDQTSFVYGPFGSGGAYDWYYTNETPMVRLNLNPNAVNSVSEFTANQGFEVFPAFPNPTSDVTRLQFRLDQASDVVIAVRDLTGKEVFFLDRGTLAAGYHSSEIALGNFSAGLYTCTVYVNGQPTTQRLSVK